MSSLPVDGGRDEHAPVLIELGDEREPAAEAALALIADTFAWSDRQPTSELRSEMAEKRLGLLTTSDFHLMASIAPTGDVMGTVSGVYLSGVNAGFVAYLVVAPKFRGRRVAQTLRNGLVEAFREDARRAGLPELDWVIGEVRLESRWLKKLLSRKGVLTFDLEYFHPGMNPESPHDCYVLYRQPLGDGREELPASLVRRLLYAIYRRGYRVRYPLEMPGFQRMMSELEGKDVVGPHSAFEGG